MVILLLHFIFQAVTHTVEDNATALQLQVERLLISDRALHDLAKKGIRTKLLQNMHSVYCITGLTTFSLFDPASQLTENSSVDN